MHPGAPGVTAERATDATGYAQSSGPDVSVSKYQPGHVPAIEDYRAVMLQRAVFQSIASMGLPAFTIHSIVRYSGRALKNAKNTRIRTYGPIGVSLETNFNHNADNTTKLGLAAVPFLPVIFDKPVEEAVEWSFYKAFEKIGGPDAVAHSTQVGRQEKLDKESKKTAIKEKEL